MAQLPAPAASGPVQVSPLLAVTVTLPVGVPAPDAAVKLNVTLWPACDGFGAEASVTATAARSTTWLTFADVPAANTPSPGYAALTVRAPTVPNTMAQLPAPAASGPVQLSPLLAVTVTLPVGVPNADAAVKLNVTPWPACDGFGAEASVTVTAARSTTWFTFADVPAANTPSPGYAALTVRAPTVPNTMAQLPAPAASGPVQLSPLLAVTVTLPVGVPNADAAVKLNVTPWPACDGFGAEASVTVTAAGSTTWFTFADVPAANTPPPGYAALTVRAPTVPNTMAQLPAPAASGPVQVSPLLAVTVTLPVGVPNPDATVKLNVTLWLACDGFGAEASVTVTGAGFTTWFTFADVPAANLPPPGYAALTVRAPAVLNTMAQLPAPAASAPVQVSPLLAVTVTLPVGVPNPDAAVKLYVTLWLASDGFSAEASVTVTGAGFTVTVAVLLFTEGTPKRLMRTQ